MQIDEMNLRKTVGKNIARYRKAHGDTQLALGRKLNYSDKAVSKWERGESLPDVYVLSQIAQLYGVSVSVLVGEAKPEIQASPYLRLFVFLLTTALIFLIVTVLIVTLELFDVTFNTWVFFLYGSIAAAAAAVVYTALWWNIWLQLAAQSALIWLGGLAVFLNVHHGFFGPKFFLICGALQAAVVIWAMYHHSRIPPKTSETEELE